MAATTGFRTCYPALVPPGATHVDPVGTAGKPKSNLEVVLAGAVFSSLLIDFFIRSSSASHLRASVMEQVPGVSSSLLADAVAENYLKLNAVTRAYAPLWREVMETEWSLGVAIRKACDRFHAQNEIDAMVALSLGVTLDELLMIYRTQFPVMRRYDQEDLYDANGRKVPKDVLKLEKKLKDGQQLSEADRTWTHPQSGVEYVFEYPFAPLDREADLAAAYEKYAAMMDKQ